MSQKILEVNPKTGDDAIGDGSLERPFQTVRRAMREIGNPDHDNGIGYFKIVSVTKAERIIVER